MKQQFKKSLLAIAITAMMTGGAMAQNIGFEDGNSTGWTGNGISAVGSQTLQAGQNTWTVNPYGSYMGKLTITNGTFSQMTSALSLTAASASGIQTTLSTQAQLTGNGGGMPTTASWTSKTVTLTAGQQFTLAWQYISTDYVPFNDGSIATLVKVGDPSVNAVLNNYTSQYALLGFTNPGTGDYSTGSYGATGWQTATYNVTSSGDYLLGFGVFNLDDTALSPVLYVDEVTGTTLKNGVTFGAVAPNPGTSAPDTSSGSVAPTPTPTPTPPPGPVLVSNVTGTTGTDLLASGNITVNGGTIQIAMTGATLTQLFDVQSGGMTIDQNSNTATASGIISGTGDVVIANSGSGGSITFTAINTYTGATTVNSGATLINDGSIASSSGVTNNGTFTNNGQASSVTNTGTFTNTGTTGNVSNSGTATNSGTVGNVTNTAGTFTNTGTAGNVTNAGTFDNSGTAGDVTNSNMFSNLVNGIINSLTNSGTATNAGTVTSTVTNTGTFTNTGTTGAVTNSGTANNSGTVGNVTNTAGTFTNNGAAGDVTNAGTVDNNGTVGAVTNTGWFTNALNAVAGFINNSNVFTNNGTTGGVINTGTFTNAGTTGNVANDGVFTNSGTTGNIYNTGTLTNIGTTGDWSNSNIVDNTGSMGNGTNAGTYTNAGTVGNVINSGTLNTSGTGGVITNSGTVTMNGGTLAGINNTGTFTVSGGTLGSYTQTNPGITVMFMDTPFTVTGAAALGGGLVINNSPTAYGKYTAFTAGSTIGEYSLLSTSGVNDYLKYSNGEVKLYVTPNATVTQSSIGNTAGNMSSMNNLQAGVINNVLGNDCNLFGDNGACISVNLANTAASSGDLASGGTTIAKRINDNWKAGLFLNNSFNKPTIGGVSQSNNPAYGGFVTWNQNADGSGFGLQGAVVTNTGKMTVTRSGPETGVGTTTTDGKAMQLKGTFSHQLTDDITLTDYVGIRRTTLNVGGYTETGPVFPLTVNGTQQTTTDLIAGIGASRKITDKLTANANIGVVQNLSNTGGSFSGTSEIGNLQTFNTALPTTKYTSAALGAGISYEVGKNQRVGVSVGWQQKGLTNADVTSYGLNYTAGF